MPRGDGGWYPVALDCAPFRFPAPNSKTKSHSTFPVENATWLTIRDQVWLWEVQRNTWCFFLKRLWDLFKWTCSSNYVEIWSSFCEFHLLCFYVSKDFMYIYKIDDALKDWRVEGLENLGILDILYLQLTTTGVSFIWHRSCINFWFVGFFLFWEGHADFLEKIHKKHCAQLNSRSAWVLQEAVRTMKPCPVVGGLGSVQRRPTLNPQVVPQSVQTKYPPRQTKYQAIQQPGQVQSLHKPGYSLPHPQFAASSFHSGLNRWCFRSVPLFKSANGGQFTVLQTVGSGE